MNMFAKVHSRSIVITAIALVIGVGSSATLTFQRQSMTETPSIVNAAPSEDEAICRFGAAQVKAPPADYPDIASLRMGWFVNFGTQSTPPAAPPGMVYAQTVRFDTLGRLVSPNSWSALEQMIAANPGAIWMLGNEPDSPFQDNMLPATYATSYHDTYFFIKQRDPSAQVGMAGIVQPTPVRFQWLDLMWDSYVEQYGEPVQTDFWNTHSYILNEDGDWGAFIPLLPPGTVPDSPQHYLQADQDNLSIFESRLRDMRQWMADHGQRNKPLYISEYGVLFPEDYTDEFGHLFDQGRAGRFMTASFDLLRTAIDSLTGDPYDGGRLVQRWLWYSIDDNPYNYGGTLYCPTEIEQIFECDGVNRTIRQLGQTYRDYTAEVVPAVDLVPGDVHFTPASPLYTGQAIDVTVRVNIYNGGDTKPSSPLLVRFFDDANGTQIGQVTLASGAPACAGSLSTAQIVWQDVTGAGLHTVRIEVDPNHAIAESDENNNTLKASILFATEQLHLPLTSH